MNSSSSSDTPHPGVELRSSRASSVIIHRVPADSAARFMEWQRGITQTAESFPGYQATDVYPPADRWQQEWVVVIHFDNPEALQCWLDSPARSEWTTKLPGEISDFRLKTLPTGLARGLPGWSGGRKAGYPPRGKWP